MTTAQQIAILETLATQFQGQPIGNVIPGLRLPLSIQADEHTLAALAAAIQALRQQGETPPRIEKDHSAALLPVDLSAAVSTEALPNTHGVNCDLDECRECNLLQLIADWRRFDGESGYAQGYGDARHESADELEAVLAGRDPYERYEPEANQSPASTEGEGRSPQSESGESAQSPAPKRPQDSGASLIGSGTQATQEPADPPRRSAAP